jgi:predicted nucleotidyltransferase
VPQREFTDAFAYSVFVACLVIHFRLWSCTMTPTMKSPPSLDEIRTVVRVACEGSGVVRMDLFGSVARNEGKPGSDVDLLVEFLPGSNVGFFEMGALKEHLKEHNSVAGLTW